MYLYLRSACSGRPMTPPFTHFLHCSVFHCFVYKALYISIVTFSYISIIQFLLCFVFCSLDVVIISHKKSHSTVIHPTTTTLYFETEVQLKIRMPFLRLHVNIGNTIFQISVLYTVYSLVLLTKIPCREKCLSFLLKNSS